ncbi:MAG: hypothetical protein IJS56_01855 [Bacilli bacterium]|nr:hypothetical protein [Bacilli bacterium]
MKKDNKEITLTAKEKKKIKDSIYDEIKDDLTVELSKSLVDEVNKQFDKEYKEELKDKISDEIKSDIKTNIRREETKLSHSKSLKIFRLYIYIILLLGLFGFVLYKLYVTNNLNVIVPDNIPLPTITREATTIVTKQEEDLVKKYEYLMNNVVINDLSLLDGQNKMSNVNITEKLKLAYNMLKSDSISIEGTIYMVSSNNLKESYNKLFSSDDYKPVDFTVSNLEYKYSTKTDSFIAIKNKDITSDDIIFEIDNVFEDDTYVYIEVITALKKNDYIYNILDTENSVIKDKGNISLSKYKSNLTKNRFVFEKEKNTLYAILKI